MKLLDTDICIEILRGNKSIIERRGATPDDTATTWITACELAYGAEKSARARENQELVDRFLATLPIFGLDPAAARHFGRIKTRLEGKGKRLADADLFISAIALARGAQLVTGNRRHYERIEELEIEDWMHAGTGTSG